MGFFLEEIFHFAKTTEFSLSVATGTAMMYIHRVSPPPRLFTVGDIYGM